MKVYDGGKRVNAACDKWVSSFALYESIGEDLVCYQCTSNFHEEAQYKSSLTDLRKSFANCPGVDIGKNVSLFCSQNSHIVSRFIQFV